MRSEKHMARINALREAMRANGIDAAFLAPSGDMEFITGLRRRPPDPVEATFVGDDLLGILVTEDPDCYVPACLRRHPWGGGDAAGVPLAQR